MNTYISRLLCLAVLSYSTCVSATLINFNSANLGTINKQTYNTLTTNVDGISTSIHAYTIQNDGNGNITNKTLLTGGTGIYFSSSSGGSLGVLSNINNDSGTIGGRSNSNDLDEGLLFAFNKVVSLNYIDFDYFRLSNNDGFNLTVDDKRVLWDHNGTITSPLVTNIAGQFDEYAFNNIIGKSFLFWSDSNSDSFRIDKMSVSTIPEPTTLLLLIIGMAIVYRSKSF